MLDSLEPTHWTTIITVTVIAAAIVAVAALAAVYRLRIVRANDAPQLAAALARSTEAHQAVAVRLGEVEARLAVIERTLNDIP